MLALGCGLYLQSLGPLCLVGEASLLHRARATPWQHWGTVGPSSSPGECRQWLPPPPPMVTPVCVPNYQALAPGQKEFMCMHRATEGELGVLTYLCHCLRGHSIHPQMYNCVCLSGILLGCVGFLHWSVNVHLVVLQKGARQSEQLTLPSC